MTAEPAPEQTARMQVKLTLGASQGGIMHILTLAAEPSQQAASLSICQQDLLDAVSEGAAYSPQDTGTPCSCKISNKSLH